MHGRVVHVLARRHQPVPAFGRTTSLQKKGLDLSDE